ncbi:prostate stem cell antigen-like [Parambassis ranga]|uniref:Prostate stem cell antigen-like n=1 Tax=Parambassis ranga TaxID=210632 RepID=A0A6P7JXM9_9TELE|nr:prostate stem cell antigen-like [Parambassis ranga]
MLRGLVLLFLCFSPVLSLECYVCSSSSTNEECNKSTQECQQPLDTCMTIVDTLGIMKAIVKQCASRATCSGAASTASVDSNGNGNTINCCSSYNLCNFSGANSIHIHTTLLLLAVGVLLLLTH